MWFNPMITWLLRSPLHGLVSKSIMLITYKGRKSSKEYTTPVNYLRIMLGQNARDLVKSEFSVDKMAIMTEQVYLKAIGSL